MLIIWGTRIRRKRCGRVAAFCERCDDIHPHHVNEVRNVSHLYYVPLGRGTLVGHEGICAGCRTTVGIDAETFAGFVDDPQAPLETLIAQTNPDLPEEVARWRDLQARIVEGDITEEERLGLVVNKIVGFADKVEARASQVHLDLWTGLAFVGGLLASIFGIALVALTIQDPGAQAIGFILAIVVMFVPAIYFAATDVPRFTRRKIIPPLADALATLCPSRDDLIQALTLVRQTKLKIGRHVKPDQLADAVALRMERELQHERD